MVIRPRCMHGHSLLSMMWHGLCVCLLITTESTTKKDEPMKMQLGGMDSGGTREPCPDPHRGRGNFGRCPCDVAFLQNPLTACCQISVSRLSLLQLQYPRSDVLSILIFGCPVSSAA